MKKCLFILALTLLTSCIHIPAEAIKLNQIVQSNIQDLHQKHVQLVNAYFTLKMKQFDIWFSNIYEPAYQENYKKIWNQQRPADPFDLNKDSHRRQYVQDSIVTYDDFLSQVRQMQDDLIKKLDTGYADMSSANAAVTDLLKSSKAVTDEQRRMWNQTAGRLIPALDTTRIDSDIKKLQQTVLGPLYGE